MLREAGLLPFAFAPFCFALLCVGGGGGGPFGALKVGDVPWLGDPTRLPCLGLMALRL